MENKEWALVLLAIIVVGVLASFATVKLTGNVVKVPTSVATTQTEIYTKAEIDTVLKNVSKGCEYVGYKDLDSTGRSFDGRSTFEACKKYNLVPKMTTRYVTNVLFNKRDCSPSYTIYSSSSHLLGRSGSGDLLGPNYKTLSCSNSQFVDGSPNGNYSQEQTWFYDGVVCCRA